MRACGNVHSQTALPALCRCFQHVLSFILARGSVHDSYLKDAVLPDSDTQVISCICAL